MLGITGNPAKCLYGFAAGNPHHAIFSACFRSITSLNAATKNRLRAASMFPRSLRHVWAIRSALHLSGQFRDVALLNLGIDSKLRGCDLVSLRVADVAPRGYAVDRASVRQKKTGRPVKFELTEQTREAVGGYLKATGRPPTVICGCSIEGEVCDGHTQYTLYTSILAATAPSSNIPTPRKQSLGLHDDLDTTCSAGGQSLFRSKPSPANNTAVSRSPGSRADS